MIYHRSFFLAQAFMDFLLGIKNVPDIGNVTNVGEVSGAVGATVAPDVKITEVALVLQREIRIAGGGIRTGGDFYNRSLNGL